VRVVTLMSGGLDSALMAAMMKDAEIEQLPLFIDYGQRALARELTACRRLCKELALSKPAIARMNGFGAIVPSGLTSPNKRLFEDAFLPCRNLLFLVTAAAYAYRHEATAVATGLLDEATTIFPDQTQAFIAHAEKLICEALDCTVRVMTPLRSLCKADVVRLARERGISGSYSCHSGRPRPCGKCVSCREFQSSEE
jgi:7-cyano-7-deazaguanine synthase